jgi:superfamily II DNA helicase RecQ
MAGALIVTDCLRDNLPRFQHQPYEYQSQSVISATAGDTLVSLPTGGGKTLVAALMPFVLAKLRRSTKLVIVISPLLALIFSQIHLLHDDYGVIARHYFSGITAAEVGAVIDAIQAGRCRLLYLCPETFVAKAFQHFLATRLAAYCKDSVVVVDEAHLAFEWGHGTDPFRPAYAQLHLHVPSTCHLALLSGTFTSKVCSTLKDTLFPGRSWSLVATASMDRPNIFYHFTRYTTSKNPTLVREIVALMSAFKRQPAAFPAIHIFCRSVNELSALYLQLLKAIPLEFAKKIAKFHASTGTEKSRKEIVHDCRRRCQ